MASDKDTIIKVTNAAVRFNMASERIDNLKEYFVKLIKRELMFQEFMALKDINFEVKRGEELGAGFDGELTATENIYLNGAVLGYSKEFMDAHYDEIVEFAELKDFMNMPIKNYSSGMAARLGFAIATIVQPEILIVDEVLAVGDAAFQEKCQERMHHMLENGTTLLFVSHTMATVRQLCDHAIWLNKGDVVMQGEAESVCDAYMESLNLPENA